METLRTHAVLVVGLIVGVLHAAGCGKTPSSDVDSDTIDGAVDSCEDTYCPRLQPPEQGFQITSNGRWIEVGADEEYCEVVQLPGSANDVYYVTRFELEMSPGSHHLLVDAILPNTQAEANATVGAIYPCIGNAGVGEAEVEGATGSQLPYHSESFPPGVGRVFYGGQKFIINYHYLNATEDRLYAKAAINFHTADASEVSKIARVFWMYNFAINVPPGQTRSFQGTCHFDSDIMLHKLTRHTHQWGTDFNVWWAGGDRDGELAFTSPNYENVDHVFDEPLLVQAGEGLRFECNYFNDTNDTLTFGNEATDEMCILLGTWYEPTDTAVGEQTCTLF